MPVADRTECFGHGRQLIWRVDDDIDVQDGFGGQTRYRRTAHMLDGKGQWPESRFQRSCQFFELVRPCRIGISDDDPPFGAHDETPLKPRSMASSSGISMIPAASRAWR